jgi:hypothetical protein
VKIDLTESEFHLVIAALQEYGTSWMALASVAAQQNSMDVSMAKQRGDALFALVRRLRATKAPESNNTP